MSEAIILEEVSNSSQTYTLPTYIKYDFNNPSPGGKFTFSGQGGDVRQANDGKLIYNVERREIALRTSLYLYNHEKQKSWKVVGRYGVFIIYFRIIFGLKNGDCNWNSYPFFF